MENLNNEQIEAINFISGPVLVLAGAGSGKTKVLTNRIANLIQNGISPFNILAVTFTNKAAYEMQQRVKNILENENIQGLTVSTFHSLGCKILRKNISVLDYKPNFTIVDEDDSLKYIKDAMDKNKIDKKEYPAKQLKNDISMIKNKEFETSDLVYKEVLFKVFNEYQNLLFKDNVLDFDDLLGLTEKILLEYPNILEYYQEKFLYIMIDEFQDTNKIQFNIVKLLAKKYKNIFIVGDQDQSIYSFRGADYKNLFYFTKEYPDYKLIKLEKNYRSTPEILNVANSIIKNNHNRFEKKLVATKEKSALPIYFRSKTSFEETIYVAEKINEFIKKGYNYSDIAVLYRSNSISRNFEDTFLTYKIPYMIYGGLSFFSRMEIKDLVSYLRLILDTSDNFSFKRVINVPKRGIGKEKMKLIEEYAITNNISYMDSLSYVNLPPKIKAEVLKFKDNILSLAEDLENYTLSNFIDLVIEKLGYEQYLKEYYPDNYDDKMDNIKEFKSVIFESKELHGGLTNKNTLENLLTDLELRTDQDKNINPYDSVVLSTYHQVKGLEFKIVFMVAMENGIFPLSKCLYNNHELEEERRICYVGITRAKEKLFLTNAYTRLHYGTSQNFIKSIFLDEIPVELLNIIGENKKKPVNPYNDFILNNYMEEQNNDLKPGDKIRHKVFGDGVIVNVEDNIIVVAFTKEFGIKKLMKNHPTIQIIKE